MHAESLTFPGHQGDSLSARLDLPADGAPLAYVLFAHCFTCGKSLKAAYNISEALNQAGFAVFRFDFTGIGESEGDFADTNFSSNVADLVAAADFLRESYQAPKILVGHSLGGAAILQAAGEIDEAVAVATIAAPADPEHVQRHFKDQLETIKQEGKATVDLAGRPFTITKQFLDDLDDHRMDQAISGLRKALLILHAPMDTTVDVENATRIFTRAKHPKSYISLDKADHLLSDEKDSCYAGRVIAAWASKYLETSKAEQDSETDVADNRVVVRTGAEGFYTEILANGHPLVADEPKAVGGSNKGPSPYELLAAALGACTTMTIRMYADRKKLPLQSATARVLHQKVHAEDCRECESTEGKIDVFEREISLEGDLTDEQRQKLLEIADKCPVHRTLHGEIVVKTRLKT